MSHPLQPQSSRPTLNLSSEANQNSSIHDQPYSPHGHGGSLDLSEAYVTAYPDVYRDYDDAGRLPSQHPGDNSIGMMRNVSDQGGEEVHELSPLKNEHSLDDSMNQYVVDDGTADPYGTKRQIGAGRHKVDYSISGQTTDGGDEDGTLNTSHSLSPLYPTFPPGAKANRPVGMSDPAVSDTGKDHRDNDLKHHAHFSQEALRDNANFYNEKRAESHSRDGSPSGRGRRGEKGNYGSPRNRSLDRQAGDNGGKGGLGNWVGPGAAKGNSVYGPLGSSLHGGGNTDQGLRSGLTSANSSNPNLVFAPGDFIDPERNAFSRFIFKLFQQSFLVRWVIYIIPLVILLWIPGIIGLTAAKNATVWTVPLVWWSAWLSIVWVCWWGTSLAARLFPDFLRYTLGVVVPESARYIAYVGGVRTFIGAAAWALINWVSFLPLIRQHERSDASDSTLALCTQGLFGIFVVLVILLVEKLIIQVIAHNFHKKSYEDRIQEQKFQIRALISLYVNSHDIGRADTLDGGISRPRLKNRRQISDPTLLLKKAVQGAKKVAQTATTVIGTVASEMAGERVLQPNSPSSMVTNAIGSANKTRHLARRLYYSFCPTYRQSLLLNDISHCFESRESAERAFQFFDRDGNGDVSLEEVEMACMDLHRERLALSRSMRDIDSAVGRLDNIIMSVWYVVAIIIIIGLLDASFNTMIASAGTLVLGLSWLIGTTAQEILASIIFLFIKHVYDVGDRVDIDGVSYTVMEMHLLSTIFKKVDGMTVQAPHSILNTKFVYNIRRSGAILERFTWDVAYETTFEQIEALRSRMLELLEVERRDFLPQIDITVDDFEGQAKLTLSANIMYKSNWQNGALKAQRRNKWTCALKIAMASLEIYGPDGAGNPNPPPPDPVPYTMVPYVEPKKVDEDKKVEKNEQAKMTGQTDVKDSGKIVEKLNDESEVINGGFNNEATNMLRRR